MRRYYFDHSEGGRFAPDARGVDCCNEADARTIAQHQVKRVVRQRLREGSVPVGGFVSVRLCCGERLMFVSYADAMAL